MENQVAKALHDGLDRLRRRGWTQGHLCDPFTGRVCARGALMDATPMSLWIFSDSKYRAADRLLCEVAAEQYPERVRAYCGPIVDVNNHPDTTQEDVERIFEKAIVRAYELVESE